MPDLGRDARDDLLQRELGAVDQQRVFGLLTSLGADGRADAQRPAAPLVEQP